MNLADFINVGVWDALQEALQEAHDFYKKTQGYERKISEMDSTLTTVIIVGIVIFVILLVIICILLFKKKNKEEVNYSYNAPTHNEEITDLGQFAANMPTQKVQEVSIFCLEIAETGLKFPLPNGDTYIGKAKENNIILKDSTVSRQHALLQIKNNQCYIRDLQSTNGVYINGSKINGQSVVKAGDTIYFGKTKALLH